MHVRASRETLSTGEVFSPGRPPPIFGPVHHRFFLPILLGLALVAAGCGGAEGVRAQELLADAQAAEAKLSSASYEIELLFTQKGQSIGLDMNGRGYLRGKRAGDQVLEMRGSGPLAGLEVELAILGEQTFVKLDGRWQAFPRPVGQAESLQLGPAVVAELARHVTRVNVQEGQLINGESLTSVSGVLDADGLVRAISDLEDFSDAVEAPSPDLAKVSEQIGDIHAVLAFSERTRLLRSAVVDFTVDDMAIRAIYRLGDVNKPVRFPKLG